MSTAGNTTDLVFDVTGYYTPDTQRCHVRALTPARLLDTRVGNGLIGQARSPTRPATFEVAGRGGVPANATARHRQRHRRQRDQLLGRLRRAQTPGQPNDARRSTSTRATIKANGLTVALAVGWHSQSPPTSRRPATPPICLRRDRLLRALAGLAESALGGSPASAALLGVAVDAVVGPRQGLEALRRDRLAAGLAQSRRCRPRCAGARSRSG